MINTLIILILLVTPFVYTSVRGNQGDYDLQIDVIIVLFLTWTLIGYTVGRLL